MKIILFFILSLNAFADESLTLSKAIKSAIETDYSMKAEKQKTIEAEQNYKSAIGYVFPNISAELNASLRKDAVGLTGSAPFGGESYNYYNGQLKLIQPIYRGGALWAGYKFASLNIEQQKMSEIHTERIITRQTLQLFLKTLLLNKKISSLKEVEKIERQGLAYTEKRKNTGRSQLLDVLQAKTVLASLLPKITQAENELHSLSAELANKIHLQSLDHLTLEGSLVDLPKDISNPTNDKSQYPDLEKLILQKEQSEYKKEVQLSGHYPQLNFVGTIGRATYRKIDIIDSNFTAWSMGLQLSVPLFSGLSSFYDRNALEAKNKELEYQVQALQENKELIQFQTKEKFKNAITLLYSTKEAFQLATMSLKEAEKNYKYSILDYSQYLTIQQNYLDARIAYDESKYNAWISYSDFLDAQGYSQNQIISTYESIKQGDKP